MSLLNLIIKLGFDGAQAESGLRSIKSSVESLGTKVAQAFGGGAIAGYVASIVQAADASSDLADQMGITVAQLYKYEDAAVQAGIKTDSLLKLFVKIAEARQKAAEGNVEEQEKLAAFGVTVDDVNNGLLDTESIVSKVFDGLQKLGKLKPDQEAIWSDLVGGKSSKFRAMAGLLGSYTPDQESSINKNVQEVGSLADTQETLWLKTKRLSINALAWLSRQTREAFLTGIGIYEGDASKYVTDIGDQEINEQLSSEFEQNKKPEPKTETQTVKAFRNKVQEKADKLQDERTRELEQRLQSELDQKTKKNEYDAIPTSFGKMAYLMKKRKELNDSYYEASNGPEEIQRKINIADNEGKILELRKSILGSAKNNAATNLSQTGNMIFGGAGKDPIPYLRRTAAATEKLVNRAETKNQGSMDIY